MRHYTKFGLLLYFPCSEHYLAKLFRGNWLSKRVKKSQLNPLAQFGTESDTAGEPPFEPNRHRRALFGMIAKTYSAELNKQKRREADVTQAPRGPAPCPKKPPGLPALLTRKGTCICKCEMSWARSMKMSASPTCSPTMGNQQKRPGVSGAGHHHAICRRIVRPASR